MPIFADERLLEITRVRDKMRISKGESTFITTTEAETPKRFSIPLCQMLASTNTSTPTRSFPGWPSANTFLGPG